MRISRFLFVLGTAGLLAACTKPADDAAKGADAAAPDAATATAATVATVNGKKLSGELYDTFVQAVTGGQMQEPLTDEQKTQLVDQLVNMTLAAQAAEKEGLQNDPKVAARIELLRTQILAEAASEKYIKAHPVSETEMKAEYDAQIASMPKEYKARHILVDKQETAESIIRELQAGGDLGWFSPQTMVKPFADAVMALEKGKYTTTPVQSEFGFHVIILDDVRNPEAPKFEDVKPQVEMFVQRKKLQEYLDGLRKTAEIQK